MCLLSGTWYRVGYKVFILFILFFMHLYLYFGFYLKIFIQLFISLFINFLHVFIFVFLCATWEWRRSYSHFVFPVFPCLILIKDIQYFSLG